MNAAQSVAWATCSNLGVDRWRVIAQDLDGIVDVIDAQPQSLSSIKLWSLLDRLPDWPGKPDRLQVEVVATVPWLEQRLTEAFGDTFSNEMGKTVGVFLNRLLPDGRAYAGGFPISRAGGLDTLSVEQLAALISTHGARFLRQVSSGSAFDDANFLSPKLLDPVNWTVRRAIALETLGRLSSARAMLSELAPRVEHDLKVKYSEIAAVSRTLDPTEQVRTHLARFNIAIDALRGDA